MQKIEKMRELITLLNFASNLYYNGKQSLMTDKEWDSNFDELRSLELETGIILSNSPTQKVGYTVVSNLEKVQHPKKMLSLDKTKDIEQLKKFLGNREGILSWKLDGLTVVLTYDNGKLIDAVTRGNGEIGSRVLHNAQVFKAGIPLTINYKGKLVVRGEALISKDDFNNINQNEEYSNPRNLASGSIMQLDSKITKQRQLQFKAFSIAECDIEFLTYEKQLEWLKAHGFNTVEYNNVSSLSLPLDIEAFKFHINNYEFATDGLVLTFNDLQYGESLGNTSHHYNNGIALKWKDETVETTLRDIQFQVGRTGVLTPIAIFDEVEIEGSMVEKASLHNLSILKGLELGIGDIVSVYKANMIIPQIDNNLTRSNTFEIPTCCPECGGEVEIKQTDNAEFVMCTNPNCKAKLVQKISHYCSRDAINIMGVSEAIIETFINKGFIETIPNLYNLEQYKDQIMNLDGFGKKSYENIIDAINNSKKTKLDRFLYALGIPNVGKGTAKDLAKYFNNDFTYFIKAIVDDYNFTKLDDIGQITADSITEWFNNINNENMVYDLLEYIEFEKVEIKEIKENPIKDKTFVVTGDVHIFKNRKEVEAKITELGGKLSSSVSKNTNYLINNDVNSPSSKNQKAKGLDVPIISEEEFIKMIG